MKVTKFGIASASLLVSACAGVSITPISSAQRGALHSGASADALGKHDNRGYVVYEPVLLVSVAPGKRCLGELKDGKCSGAWQDFCEVSEPKLFPNYNRPYLVKSSSGFGKAGTEIAIKDGWLLSNVKDSSDNTAILSALLGKDTAGTTQSKGAKGGDPLPACAVGVYMVPSGCDPEKPDTCQPQPFRLRFE